VWFDHGKINALQISKEINLRLKSSTLALKFRSRKAQPLNDALGVLRGIVTPKFAPLDDMYIFDMLKDLSDRGKVPIQFLPPRYSSFFEGSRTANYSIVTGQFNVGTTESPDWITHGINIRNSEVGFCALTFKAFAYRLICKNGSLLSLGKELVGKVIHKARDIGKKLFCVQEMLEHLLSTSGNTEKIFREMVSIKSKISTEEELDRMGARYKFPKFFMKMVKDALPEKDTPWNIFNAITDSAKNINDPEKRYSIELGAGTYLEEKTQKKGES
jgi:hypothetical protein